MPEAESNQRIQSGEACRMGEMLLIEFLEEVEYQCHRCSCALELNRLFLLLCFVNFSLHIQCHEWLIFSPLKCLKCKFLVLV